MRRMPAARSIISGASERQINTVSKSHEDIDVSRSFYHCRQTITCREGAKFHQKTLCRVSSCVPTCTGRGRTGTVQSMDTLHCGLRAGVSNAKRRPPRGGVCLAGKGEPNPGYASALLTFTHAPIRPTQVSARRFIQLTPWTTPSFGGTSAAWKRMILPSSEMTKRSWLSM